MIIFSTKSQIVGTTIKNVLFYPVWVEYIFRKVV